MKDSSKYRFPHIKQGAIDYILGMINGFIGSGNSIFLDDCLLSGENLTKCMILDELNDLTSLNPYALLDIDCDQIQHWQTLAQHTAPASVQSKIEALPSSWTNDFEIPSMCTTETELWESDDPLGSIIYIDIPIDEGVVVCTEYTNSYWYFMTMNAPYAGNHPVSGTRQFAYVQNPDGSFDFFVRGVDRFDQNGAENFAFIIDYVSGD